MITPPPAASTSTRNATVVLFRRHLESVMGRSGLSPAAFARAAGIDRSTLSQLMTDENPRLPRAETLMALAKAAHVSVDWLLGLSQREEVGAEIIEAMLPDRDTGPPPGRRPFRTMVERGRGLSHPDGAHGLARFHEDRGDAPLRVWRRLCERGPRRGSKP